MLVQERVAGGFCWYCNCGAPEGATCWFAQNMWQSLRSLPASLSECLCGCEEHSADRNRRKEGGVKRGKGEWTVLAATALST